MSFVWFVACGLALPGGAAAQHEHHAAPPAVAPERPDPGTHPATDRARGLLTRPPRTVEVAPGRSLVEAVSAAVPGDTILVVGAHRGDLRILVPLVLSGRGPGARVIGSGAGTVVSVEADSVEVSRLGIAGSGTSLERDDAAIKLLRCRGCRIEDNRIEDALHGIYLLESVAVRVHDNRILGRADLEEARRGNGIHLYASSGNRIERNSVRGARDGIYFSFADDNDVAGNDIARLRYGLHYMYSDDNRFRGNRFEHNAAGAAIMFSDRIEFRDNVFSHHTGARAYGIVLQTAAEILAEGNRIEGNVVGLFMDNAVTSVFRRTAIAGNGIGIDMLSSAEANRFTENAIVGNRVAVRRQGETGLNDWAVGGRGNYWGDASVFDLDGDGVGERAYQAGDPFVSLAAGKPALSLFQGTPAARALGWAERAFPVFDLPHVRDPFPLTALPAGVPVSRAAGVAAGGIELPALALAALLIALIPLGFDRLRRIRAPERLR
jgi:nitrous oxidase accessory protein